MGSRLLGDVRTFCKMRLQAILDEVQINIVDTDGWKTRWKALMPTECPKRDPRVRELIKVGTFECSTNNDDYLFLESASQVPRFRNKGIVNAHLIPIQCPKPPRIRIGSP